MAVKDNQLPEGAVQRLCNFDYFLPLLSMLRNATLCYVTNHRLIPLPKSNFTLTRHTRSHNSTQIYKHIWTHAQIQRRPLRREENLWLKKYCNECCASTTQKITSWILILIVVRLHFRLVLRFKFFHCWWLTLHEDQEIIHSIFWITQQFSFVPATHL